VRPTSHRLALLVLASAGCGGEDADALVVVGLTTDMAVGFDIRHVDRTTKVNGGVTRAESLSYSSGDLSLPAEIQVEGVKDGADVEVTLEAFRGDDASPFMTRRASTRAAGGRRLLLPVSLDEACSALVCPDGATCDEGACVEPFIAPAILAEYDPTWLASAPDACKTPASGDPEIVIGKGESAFTPLEKNEVVAIEAGPQGGHHVWLALRVTGLRQMGSILTVEGTFPELSYELLPFTSHVTLRKTAESHCEIYGVRFQVDRGIPVAEVRGRALDIDIALKDPNGDVATAMKRVVIAP
jgi:hypothetical protein